MPFLCLCEIQNNIVERIELKWTKLQDITLLWTNQSYSYTPATKKIDNENLKIIKFVIAS